MSTRLHHGSWSHSISLHLYYMSGKRTTRSHLFIFFFSHLVGPFIFYTLRVCEAFDFEHFFLSMCCFHCIVLPVICVCCCWMQSDCAKCESTIKRSNETSKEKKRRMQQQEIKQNHTNTNQMIMWCCICVYFWARADTWPNWHALLWRPSK